MSKKNNDQVIEDAKIADDVYTEVIETEEEFEIIQVIVAVKTVKDSVLKVLGGDAEKLFVQLETALEFKKNQDEFLHINAEEAAAKQAEKRDAEVLAMQEAAAQKLEELNANVTL